MDTTHTFTIGAAMMAAINMTGKNIMQEKLRCNADGKNQQERQCKKLFYGNILFQEMKLSCK